MSLTILGTGSAMPEKRLTNEELTHMVDTSDEWIITRTGIHERRIITTETCQGLARGPCLWPWRTRLRARGAGADPVHHCAGRYRRRRPWPI